MEYRMFYQAVIEKIGVLFLDKKIHPPPPKKNQKIVHRRGISQEFDSSKTSGLGLVVEYFVSVNQLLTTHYLHII